MQDKLFPVLVVLIVVVIAVLTIVVVGPLFVPHHYDGRKSMCQSNMKEIALAFNMYTNDNNDTLPSSAISHAPERSFRTTLGQMPPPTYTGYKAKTVFELLYPYWKHSRYFFCPSDQMASAPNRASKPTSYVMKKAINDAWIAPKIKARKEVDFNWPSEQLLFYERRSFHWGDNAGDLNDPRNTRRLDASFNCAFMDTHVKTHRLSAIDPKRPKDLLGEPDYYNTDGNTLAPVKRPQINPRLYCDQLR